MQAQFVEPDEISFSAAISACEKCEEWERALWILAEMHEQAVEANIVSFNAAISACERCSHVNRGLTLMFELQQRGIQQSLSSLTWALARLSVSNRHMIHAALGEAVSQLKAS